MYQSIKQSIKEGANDPLVWMVADNDPYKKQWALELGIEEFIQAFEHKMESLERQAKAYEKK